MHTLRRTTIWLVAAVIWSCSGSVTGVDRTPGEGVAAITVAPSTVTLVAGAEAPLQATVHDESGRVRTDVPVVWSVKDTTIARVSAAGVVSARNVGNTQVAASAMGVSAIATLTVQAPAVASVLVQPLAQALTVGQSVTFSATTRDVNGMTLTGRVVTWTSSNDAVATVAQSGEVTARSSGTATITATSEGASGSATVTVSQVPVASVTVSPADVSLEVGRTVALAVAVRDVNGGVVTDRPVTWASSNPSVATVTQTGIVTAKAVGSATISATAGGKSGSAAVTVTTVPVAAIAVNPTTSTLIRGETVQLAATLKDASGTVLTDRAVTWTSSDNTIAIVSAAGVVTGVAPGAVTITATSEGKSATAAVTVVSPPIASVTVLPASTTIQIGGGATLTATVKDITDAVVPDAAVTWSSSNTAVATVSATGVVTGQAVGTTTISATSGGRTGTASVNVVLVPVASVSVSPPSLTLVPTETATLSATVRDANSTVVTDRVVTWKSSNTAVATVSASGFVTAVAPGSAIVTATSEGKTGSTSIVVVPKPVGSVVVSPPTGKITAGQTLTLSATVRDTSGAVVTDRAVAWSSSNTTIATVSSAGIVTAVNPGTATITASSEGKSGSAVVTVQPIPVASVTLDPGSVTLGPGENAQLVATTKSADGTVLTGRVVTFTSSNTKVAMVSSDGVVTGIALGTATITATSEGKSTTAAVTVQPVVAYVIVSPDVVFLKKGGTVQLTAKAYDASGNPIVGRAVTWATADDHVATVDENGVVTAKKPGKTTISATVDGKVGTATVQVTN